MFKFFKKNNENHPKNNPSIEDTNGVFKDMTLIDAYYIPNDQVEQYTHDRERYSDALLYILSQFYETTERCFEGSDDGEAIVAFDDDIPKKIVYLDPETVDALRMLETTKSLKQAIIEYCEID